MLMQDRAFGIEIECINQSHSQRRIAERIRHYNIGAHEEYWNRTTRPHWKVITDSSLSSGGKEVVSPILRGDVGVEQVKLVCRALNDINTKVDRSCGLHVHIDMGGENLDTWKKLCKLYVKYEPQIDKIMAPSRRHNGAYYTRSNRNECADVMELIDAAKSMSDLREVWGDDRYRKLNLQAALAHGTVEFRHHGGTVDGDKIVAWLNMCMGMVNAAKRAKYIKNTVGEEKFENFLKLTDCKATRRFLRKRAKHFGTI